LAVADHAGRHGGIRGDLTTETSGAQVGFGVPEVRKMSP
jgi:hypothetical protein